MKKAAVLSPPNSMLMTVADVCDLLQITDRTVRKWTDNGKLPVPIRMGRRIIRFRRADIEALLEKPKTG